MSDLEPLKPPSYECPLSWVIGEHTTVVITGGSAGIGLETARGLARRGAQVTIVARNPKRTPEVADALRRDTRNDRIDHVLADFSCLDEVRRAADIIRERNDRIDVLINNAGVWHPQRRSSRDGFEDCFAVNHLAHFVLTNALLDRMQAPARIVHVSSRLHSLVRSLPLSELAGGPGFDAFGFLAYARSKLCNLLFSLALSRRLPSGIVSHTVHPGDVKTDVARDMWLTSFGMKLVGQWLLTPEQGAANTLHVASVPHLSTVTGRYFVDCRDVPPSAAAQDVGLADGLWALSAELTSGRGR